MRPAPEPEAPSRDPAGRRWLARLGTLLLAIVFLRLGFELWWVGRIHEHLWTQVGVSLLYLAGVIFLGLSAMDIRHERLDTAGFLCLCGALGFYAVAHMTVFAIHYTSDALLFVHQSAYLVLDGLNPYQHSLVGGYEAFNVPYYVQTPTTSGGLVTNMNYPALAFLVYLPFTALGLEDLRPISAGFLVATLGLVYLAVPRHLRLLVLGLMFLSSFFLSFALSGFDIVYVFFLLFAVVMWKKHPGAAMLAFGLAAAVKQPVWFIAPFLLVKLWRDAPQEERRARAWHVVKNTCYCIGAFLVPNAWFIVWDPQAWFQGVLTPIGGSGDVLVPLSQGLTIVFYTGTLRVHPLLLTALSMSLMLCLLGFYWLKYDRLKDMLWIAPAFILVVGARSLQNYYEMFYPVMLCMLMARIPTTWDDEPPPQPAVTHRRHVIVHAQPAR